MDNLETVKVDRMTRKVLAAVGKAKHLLKQDRYSLRTLTETAASCDLVLGDFMGDGCQLEQLVLRASHKIEVPRDFDAMGNLKISTSTCQEVVQQIQASGFEGKVWTFQHDPTTILDLTNPEAVLGRKLAAYSIAGIIKLAQDNPDINFISPNDCKQSASGVMELHVAKDVLSKLNLGYIQFDYHVFYQKDGHNFDKIIPIVIGSGIVGEGQPMFIDLDRDRERNIDHEFEYDYDDYQL